MEDQAVSEAVIEQWAPVFGARRVDDNAMVQFARHIPAGAGYTEWEWASGNIQPTAALLPASAPGPDGLPYAFWASAPPLAVAFLENIAFNMTLGIAPPAVLLDSLTLFIPKGEYAEDVERLIRRITEPRPTTPMQTSAKVIASVANSELSAIAKATVAGEQRGLWKAGI